MQATLIGFSAILMWSLLALLTALSGEVPPFQLAAMCFSIAAAIGLTALAAKPSGFRNLRQPLRVWCPRRWGAVRLSLFLLHCPAQRAGCRSEPDWLFLASADRRRFSEFLPGERLDWQHITGVLAGLAGTVLIVSKNSLSFNDSFAFGYGAALLSAFTWSAYSLLSRRFGAVPTDAVTGFCTITAIFSLICHLALEQTVWPQGTGQWLAVAGLGLLPVGAAFYAWDFGVKRDDIRVLGTASYAAPLLSTLILIASGGRPGPTGASLLPAS